MATSPKNPGLGNSGTVGISVLVSVTRLALLAFCAWNAYLYWEILTSFFPAGGFVRLLISFVALILWALLQTLECLPLLVRGSLGSLALLIKAAERFRGLELNANDNALVKSLKRQYNAYPQRWLGRVVLLGYGAFVCDLCILLNYFRPFEVQFTGLSFNWAELLWLLICLSTVQITVFVWLLAEGGKAVFKPVAGAGGGAGAKKAKPSTRASQTAIPVRAEEVGGDRQPPADAQQQPSQQPTQQQPKDREEKS